MPKKNQPTHRRYDSTKIHSFIHSITPHLPRLSGIKWKSLASSNKSRHWCDVRIKSSVATRSARNCGVRRGRRTLANTCGNIEERDSSNLIHFMQASKILSSVGTLSSSRRTMSMSWSNSVTFIYVSASMIQQTQNGLIELPKALNSSDWATFEKYWWMYFSAALTKFKQPKESANWRMPRTLWEWNLFFLCEEKIGNKIDGNLYKKV